MSLIYFRPDCTQRPRAGFEQAMQTPAGGLCCTECTYWPAGGPSRRHRETCHMQRDPTLPCAVFRRGRDAAGSWR